MSTSRFSNTYTSAKSSAGVWTTSVARDYGGQDVHANALESKDALP